MNKAKYLTAASALTLALGLAAALVTTGPELAASAQTTTTTTASTTTTATTGTVPANLAPDQLALTGTCIPAATLLETAEEAVDEYVPGGDPAGVYVNGMWLPASYLAAFAGNYIVGPMGCTSTTPVPTTVPVSTTTTTTTVP